jgi:hypothetical protein|tara:strand:+ start:224 stop:496 length:273 start_codon:yes stop_codon:yes gene_type:complete
MVLPFKLVTDPNNSQRRIPVFEGDDRDVIFRNSRPVITESPGLSASTNLNNKWSTLIDYKNRDVTVTNALKRGDFDDDNKVAARKSLRNY